MFSTGIDLWETSRALAVQKKKEVESMRRYTGRFFVREKGYACRDRLSINIYRVFQPRGKRRCKCKESTEVQKRMNQINAEKLVKRLAALNFCEKDMALHLTYREEPQSIEQAQKDLYNFLRRVKRMRRKLGLEDLKYISSTEKGKTTGRLHHHVMISGGLDRDTMEKLWGKGFANSKRLQLDEQGSLDALSHYMIKSEERTAYRRWNCSKNLIRPTPTVRDGAYTVDDMTDMQDAIYNGCAEEYFESRYEGYTMEDAVCEINTVTGELYIRVELRRAAMGEHRKRRK